MWGLWGRGKIKPTEYGLNRKSKRATKIKVYRNPKKKKSWDLENVELTFLVKIGLVLKYLVQKKLKICCLWNMLATAAWVSQGRRVLFDGQIFRWRWSLPRTRAPGKPPTLDFTNYFIFIISSALPLIVYFHQHEQNKGKDISSFKGENFRYSLYKDVN